MYNCHTYIHISVIIRITYTFNSNWGNEKYALFRVSHFVIKRKVKWLQCFMRENLVFVHE